MLTMCLAIPLSNTQAGTELGRRKYVIHDFFNAYYRSLIAWVVANGLYRHPSEPDIS